MWLQLLLSLIVIAIAAVIAGIFLPSANTMLARVGVSLPLLTGAPDPGITGAGAGRPRQAQGQRQGSGRRQAGQGGQGRWPAAASVAPTASRLSSSFPPTTGIINNQLAAIGEGTAVNSVTINTASGGTLISVDVKPGDHVAAGQKLAMLDSDTQQNAVDKAKLALSDADATLARTQQLAKSNNVPTKPGRCGKAGRRQCAARAYRQRRSRSTSAPSARRSPARSASSRFRPATSSTPRASSPPSRTTPRSSSISGYPSAMPARSSVGMPVAATSSALPGKNFAGKVTAIDNKIDPDSRTLQIQATIPNPDGDHQVWNVVLGRHDVLG